MQAVYFSHNGIAEMFPQTEASACFMGRVASMKRKRMELFYFWAWIISSLQCNHDVDDDLLL